MTPQEYLATQVALVAAAKAVFKLDLPAFLADICRAESTGPLLDPTLYRRAGGRLERVKRLARAAMVLRGEVLAQVREDLGGAAEVAGLMDEVISALATPALPVVEAGSGGGGGDDTSTLSDSGIPPARPGTASDPAPPAGHETDSSESVANSQASASGSPARGVPGSEGFLS